MLRVTGRVEVVRIPDGEQIRKTMKSVGEALQAIFRGKGVTSRTISPMIWPPQPAVAAIDGCRRKMVHCRNGLGRGGVQDVSQGGVAVGWGDPLRQLWAVARTLPLFRGKSLSGADRSSEDPHREASWQDGHGGR